MSALGLVGTSVPVVVVVWPGPGDGVVEVGLGAVVVPVGGGVVPVVVVPVGGGVVPVPVVPVGAADVAPEGGAGVDEVGSTGDPPLEAVVVVPGAAGVMEPGYGRTVGSDWVWLRGAGGLGRAAAPAVPADLVPSVLDVFAGFTAAILTAFLSVGGWLGLAAASVLLAAASVFLAAASVCLAADGADERGSLEGGADGA